MTKTTSFGNHLGFYKATKLPHYDEAGLIQSITFRLADSLSPDHVYSLTHGQPDDSTLALFSAIDDELDRNFGACWLRIPEIANLVRNALRHFHGERYNLICWVIMPNHVHCIIQQKENYPLAGIVKSWEAFTATRANKILGRQGRFWQRDYFDRYVRKRSQLEMAADYIHYNPVSAGLCKRMEDWPWSSYRELSGV